MPETVRVRVSVLSAASPVFEHMFSEAQHVCDETITMDDTTHAALQTFVRMAGLTSYDTDGDNLPHVDDRKLLDSVCDETLRLIHKYEANGILALVKASLQRCPIPSRVIAIVELFEEDNPDWLVPAILDAVLADVMHHDSSRVLAKLPRSLLVTLLTHCFERQSPRPALMNVFRPVIGMG